MRIVRLFLKLLFFIAIVQAHTALGQEKPLIVASASMLTDITQNIGGNLIDVKMIVPIGGDPHIYEPTPGDVALVNKADLIFINGLTFEGWINELIENSGSKATTITVTRGIDVLTSQQYRNSSDPHAWMSAANGRIYARNIKDALVELLPQHQEVFEANYATYDQELQELDTYIEKRIQEIPQEKRVLVTSHDAFQYYGQRYHIRLEAIMGISTEAEAQTSDIIRVNKVIKESKLPAIFVESTINPKLINQLATDNKIKIGGKLYADSLGDIDSPGSTYIKMLKYNTDTIVKALSDTTEMNQEESSGNGFYLWIMGGVMLLGLVLLVYKINQ
jgi:ABC-type Zn uptake system ZnuABC Zn-binding protein ZnuA